MSSAQSKNYHAGVAIRSFSPGVMARTIFAQAELFDDEDILSADPDLGPDDDLETLETGLTAAADDLHITGMDKAVIEDLFLDGTLPAPVWGMEPAPAHGPVAATLPAEAALAEDVPDFDPGLSKRSRNNRPSVVARARRSRVKEVIALSHAKRKKETDQHPELLNDAKDRLSLARSARCAYSLKLRRNAEAAARADLRTGA